MRITAKKIFFYILLGCAFSVFNTYAEVEEDEAFKAAASKEVSEPAKSKTASSSDEEQISEDIYNAIKDVKTPAVEFLGSSKFTTESEVYQRLNSLKKALDAFEKNLMAEYAPKTEDTKSDSTGINKDEVKEMIKTAVQAAVDATAQPATATIQKDTKPTQATNPFLAPIPTSMAAVPAPINQAQAPGLTPLPMPNTNFAPISTQTQAPLSTPGLTPMQPVGITQPAGGLTPLPTPTQVGGLTPLPGSQQTPISQNTFSAPATTPVKTGSMLPPLGSTQPAANVPMGGAVTPSEADFDGGFSDMGFPLTPEGLNSILPPLPGGM